MSARRKGQGSTGASLNCDSSHMRLSASIEKLVSAGRVWPFTQAQGGEIGVRGREKLVGFVGEPTVIDVAAGARTLHREVQRLLRVAMHPEVDAVREREQVEREGIVDAIMIARRYLLKKILQFDIVQG